MENNNPPKICPFCNSPIKEIPAGLSKRTGNSYKRFWACENRECKFVWHPKDAPQKPEQPNPMMLILDEVRATNKRLDKMADYLLEKLK